MSRKRTLAPVHPGEILREDLSEIGVSMNALAEALRVPANRILGIVRGDRAVTPETALRLAQYFGTSAEYWLNLQSKYDLDVAKNHLAGRIRKEVLPRSA
jgi:addiction module HigA family antidote